MFFLLGALVQAAAQVLLEQVAREQAAASLEQEPAEELLSSPLPLVRPSQLAAEEGVSLGFGHAPSERPSSSPPSAEALVVPTERGGGLAIAVVILVILAAAAALLLR